MLILSKNKYEEYILLLLTCNWKRSFLLVVKTGSLKQTWYNIPNGREVTVKEKENLGQNYN